MVGYLRPRGGGGGDRETLARWMMTGSGAGASGKKGRRSAGRGPVGRKGEQIESARMYIYMYARVRTVTFRVENYRENESAAKVIYRLSWHAGITESPLPLLPLPPSSRPLYIYIYYYVLCLCVCLFVCACVCVNARGMAKIPLLLPCIVCIYIYICNIFIYYFIQYCFALCTGHRPAWKLCVHVENGKKITIKIGGQSFVQRRTTRRAKTLESFSRPGSLLHPSRAFYDS